MMTNDIISKINNILVSAYAYVYYVNGMEVIKKKAAKK